jgi:hypothetical protein
MALITSRDLQPNNNIFRQIQQLRGHGLRLVVVVAELLHTDGR